MQITHKFYLGQKVKTFFKGKEKIGRVIHIKIRTKQCTTGQKQVLDPDAIPIYRIEGIVENIREQDLTALEP